MKQPSSTFPFRSRYVDVLGSPMHYIDEGTGSPVLFLHGNPTSSYLWRNIVPTAARHGRAIAVDLIGMGMSAKPDLAYRFSDHLRYLEAFIEELDLHDVTLVLHDWGGGLGTSWARRHTDDVRAIAFMESILFPLEWSDADLLSRVVFRRMRHPEKGDRMNVRRAFFLERLMPMLTRRRLTTEERATYAAPYPRREHRRVIAQWPREIPFSGEPADTAAEIGSNYAWFRTAPIPKLFLHAAPGLIFTRATVARVEAEVDDLDSRHLGKGKHYLPEDLPEEISAALDEWLPRVVAGHGRSSAQP